MRLIAIRHGETDWNTEQRLQGRSDIPLNGTGREQARAAATSLPDGIDIILASPLVRAIETAGILNVRFGVPIVLDERLVERDFGDFEGMYMADCDMVALRSWAANAPTPNGETLRDVGQRVAAFLGEVMQTYDKQTVLLVAHGHVIRAIYWYCHLYPQRDEESVIETPPCGFYIFDL